MTLSASTRFTAILAFTASVFACACIPASAQSQGYQPPAAIERRQPQQPPAQASAGVPIERRNPTPGNPKMPTGEHLAVWMQLHSNETPNQKLQSLEKEPGFHDLPPQTQQRMRNQLLRLDSMPPQKQSRIIARTEMMERLTPDQRSQVRGALQQLGNIPQPNRRNVARTFRIIRGMPPSQRLNYLNSPEVRPLFSPQERDTLIRLMQVEPYLPPPNAADPQ